MKNKLRLKYQIGRPRPVMQLSASTLVEASAAGTLVGGLTLSDGSTGWTFSITSQSIANSFAIDGAALEAGSVATSVGFSPYSVSIRATKGGVTLNKTFPITVTAAVADKIIALAGGGMTEGTGPDVGFGLLTVQGGTGNEVFTVTGAAVTANIIVQRGVRGQDLVTGAVAADYETATTHSIHVVTNTGLSADFVLPVANVLEVVLGSLTLTTPFVDEGTPAGVLVASITGLTSGSTRTLTNNAGGLFSLIGTGIWTAALIPAASVASAFVVELREEAVDAFPRTTSFSIINLSEVAAGDPGTAGNPWRFDSVAGNDTTGDGSLANPWRTPAVIQSRPINGGADPNNRTHIAFKAGSAFVHGLDLNGRGDNWVITAYGDPGAGPAVFSGLYSVKGVTGDWVRVAALETIPPQTLRDGSFYPGSGVFTDPTNVWRRSNLNDSDGKDQIVFPGHIGGRWRDATHGGTGQAADNSAGFTPIAASPYYLKVTQARDWTRSGTTLTVFATANPATHFATLLGCMQTYGGAPRQQFLYAPGAAHIRVDGAWETTTLAGIVMEGFNQLTDQVRDDWTFDRYLFRFGAYQGVVIQNSANDNLGLVVEVNGKIWDSGTISGSNMCYNREGSGTLKVGAHIDCPNAEDCVQNAGNGASLGHVPLTWITPGARLERARENCFDLKKGYAKMERAFLMANQTDPIMQACITVQGWFILGESDECAISALGTVAALQVQEFQGKWDSHADVFFSRRSSENNYFGPSGSPSVFNFSAFIDDSNNGNSVMVSLINAPNGFEAVHCSFLAWNGAGKALESRQASIVGGITSIVKVATSATHYTYRITRGSAWAANRAIEIAGLPATNNSNKINNPVGEHYALLNVTASTDTTADILVPIPQFGGLSAPDTVTLTGIVINYKAVINRLAGNLFCGYGLSTVGILNLADVDHLAAAFANEANMLAGPSTLLRIGTTNFTGAQIIAAGGAGSLFDFTGGKMGGPAWAFNVAADQYDDATETILYSNETAVVTKVGHGYKVGDRVSRRGATPDELCGTHFTTRVPDADHYEFQLPRKLWGASQTQATGTIKSTNLNLSAALPSPVFALGATTDYHGNEVVNTDTARSFGAVQPASAVYVSPLGNDSWNGLYATFAGGSNGPKLTLAGAQAAMAGSSGALRTAYMLAGVYPQTSPVTFGAANANNRILAYGDGTPEISGGKLIANFVNAGGGLWTANLTGIMTTVLQLTVNGVRKISARHPNFNPADPIRGGWLWAVGAGSATTMGYTAGDFGAGQLAVGMKALVIPAAGYTSDVMTITNVNTSTHVITFDHAADSTLGPGTRYYVFGAAVLLDADDEWHFNTTSKVLTYKPAAGSGFDGSGAVVSSGDGTLIAIDGAKVEIRGIKFRDLTTTAGSDDIATAAITIANSVDSFIWECLFENVVKGVLLKGTSHGSVLWGNFFTHTWASAVYMDPGSYNNVVHNNTIRFTGEVFKTSGAVHYEECRQIYVKHNVISDCPRFGVSSINYTSGTESGSNITEYNDIRRTMQETPDGGSVYKFVDDADVDRTPGDIIRYNYIEDAPGLNVTASGFVTGPDFGFGVYLDNNVGDTDVYGNFIKAGGWSPILVHGGPNNRITNNLCVFGSDAPSFETVGFLDVGVAMPGTLLKQNILQVQVNGEVTVSREAASAIPAANINQNYYFNPTNSTAHRWGTGVTFASWQTSGFDAASTVTPSVGFVGTGTYPYMLTPGSAPLVGGYVELPWAQMGLE